MHTLFVSDIFGRTEALERLCRHAGGRFTIVDPYDGEDMGFRSEQEAYAFFMGNIGMETYGGILRACLERALNPFTLVGFSVGASAVWRISASLDAEQVKRVLCFYGSQVRNCPDINPGVSVDHILPLHEPGFSVDELARRLQGKANVVLHRTSYLHGFMNELSGNYSESGYREYVSWIHDRNSRPDGLVRC